MFEKLFYAVSIVGVLIISVLIFHIEYMKKKLKDENERKDEEWRDAVGELAQKSRVLTTRVFLVNVKTKYEIEAVVSAPIRPKDSDTIYVQIFKLSADGSRIKELTKGSVRRGSLVTETWRAIYGLSGDLRMQVTKEGDPIQTYEEINVEVGPQDILSKSSAHAEEGVIDFCDKMFQAKYTIDGKGFLCLSDISGPIQALENFHEFLMDKLGDYVCVLPNPPKRYVFTELTAQEAYEKVIEVAERSVVEFMFGQEGKKEECQLMT